jgi:hypothetical protein
MALKEKYGVRLRPQQRRQRERLVATGKHPAATLVHARILLKADAGPAGPGWAGDAIAEALECGPSTVARIRNRFAQHRLETAVHLNHPLYGPYSAEPVAVEGRHSAAATA